MIRGLQGDVFGALAWVANWRLILDGRTYADAFSDPSPVQHFWSLAVEEQFYLALPLLATAVVAATRIASRRRIGRQPTRRPRLADGDHRHLSARDAGR